MLALLRIHLQAVRVSSANITSWYETVIEASSIAEKLILKQNFEKNQTLISCHDLRLSLYFLLSMERKFLMSTIVCPLRFP